MSTMIESVSIHYKNKDLDIEYQWVGNEDLTAPLLIFLHEGLGSVSMWKDFPHEISKTLGFRGLVYSRPGYGQSSPAEDNSESWGTDFMHQQAYDVLPLFLQAMNVHHNNSPFWLLGHSDGASIAMLYAAKHPSQCAGLIVLAPHIMVEDITLSSIALARTAYLETNLPKKLSAYHKDPDSIFWKWLNIWLDPAFQKWTIQKQIPDIQCPLLAIQGQDDEYGTLEQIRGIKHILDHAQLLELPDCRHSPHRDQAKHLIKVATDFIHYHTQQEKLA